MWKEKYISGRSQNFWLLELSSSLHFIASSVSSIFIPIIMLNIGFSLKDVIIYYILFHFLDVIFNFFSKKLLKKKGLKFSYILGTLFIIGFFITYLFLENQNWYILSLMAVLAAIYDSIYWLAFYYGTMANTLDIENSEKNNILINIIAAISFFIGPLIGVGIIILSENKDILLATTIFIFILSLIPLRKYKILENKDRSEINFRKYFQDKRNLKNFISWGLYKITESAEGIIFPIFIYLIFKELDSVAYISIIAVFTSLFLTFISGNVAEKNREKMVILGSFTLIFIWLGRIFIENEFYLYLSVALIGTFALLIKMPIETSIFKNGKKYNELQTAFYKNTISMGSKLLFYIFVFFLLEYTELKNTFWLIPIFLGLIIITNSIYWWQKLKLNKK